MKIHTFQLNFEKYVGGGLSGRERGGVGCQESRV